MIFKRKQLDVKGGALGNEISDLMTGKRESALLLQVWMLARTQGQRPNLGLADSRTMRDKFILFTGHLTWCSVIVASIKTPIFLINKWLY